MAQPPGVYDLTFCEDEDRRVIQGADNIWTLAFDTAYGSDWSGFACRGQLRQAYRDEDANVSATLTCTILDAGPTQRVVQFHLPASEAELVTADSGRWDAEIYNGTLVYRIVAGKWQLFRQVTE